jgi:hypothetical protein
LGHVPMDVPIGVPNQTSASTASSWFDWLILPWRSTPAIFSESDDYALATGMGQVVSLRCSFGFRAGDWRTSRMRGLMPPGGRSGGDVRQSQAWRVFDHPGYYQSGQNAPCRHLARSSHNAPYGFGAKGLTQPPAWVGALVG